jgi:hypothetical protein
MPRVRQYLKPTLALVFERLLRDIFVFSHSLLCTNSLLITRARRIAARPAFTSLTRGDHRSIRRLARHRLPNGSLDPPGELQIGEFCGFARVVS